MHVGWDTGDLPSQGEKYGYRSPRPRCPHVVAPVWRFRALCRLVPRSCTVTLVGRGAKAGGEREQTARRRAGLWRERAGKGGLKQSRLKGSPSFAPDLYVLALSLYIYVSM